MLWHIKLKFCLWLCLIVLHIKFESPQFASIFVGVTPLLKLRILEIHSLPHFSPKFFDILSWNFAFDFHLKNSTSSSSVINCCRSYALFGTYNTENAQFSALFSYTLWHIELKFCIWLSFNILNSSLSVVNLRQYLKELCLFLNLEYRKYAVSHSFPHFSPTCFDIFWWNFAYDFV